MGLYPSRCYPSRYPLADAPNVALSTTGQHGDLLGGVGGQVVLDASLTGGGELALLGDLQKVPVLLQSGALNLNLDPVCEVLANPKEGMQVAGIAGLDGYLFGYHCFGYLGQLPDQRLQGRVKPAGAPSR